MKAIKIVAGAIIFLLVACDGKNNTTETNSEVSETTIEETVVSGGKLDESTVDSVLVPSASEWSTSEELIEVSLPEFDGTEIRVYEGKGQSIYSIGKNVLFMTGSAGLRAGTEQSLRKVGNALAQRNKEGLIRIYGYIDATENPNYKRDMAERRIQALKEWLQNNSNIDGARIAVQPIVELQSASDNGDELQKDQRFEIVARNEI